MQLRRLLGRTIHVISAVILLGLLAAAWIGPAFVPYEPTKIDVGRTLQPPSADHWLGNDQLGRDVLVRVLYGMRISIGIGLLGMGLAAIIGVVIGAVAGYFGGWIDLVLMRLVDVFLSVPAIILVLFLASIHGPSGGVIIAVMGLVGWCWTARITRGEFLRLKRKEFVDAARVDGLTDGAIMFRHILVNALSPIIVDTTQGVGGTILLESAVSYLGLGVQPPQASLGSMLFQAQTYLLIAPWIAIIPGLFILIIVLNFMILGDGLRDALDPAR